MIVKTTPLRFMMNETPLLEQIIELLYCLLPKKIPVQQKIRHLSRRKQSIGEEFIDAFENMYEQLKHSAISSDKVVKKNIAKDSSSLKLIAIIDGCDFFFESIMVKMSPITA